MVSIPSGINVPGSDKAIIDIASKLKAMPDASCGWGSKAVYIVAIAKPKNTLLPLYVPVSGATIEGRVLSVGLIEIKKLTAFANLDGITSACVPILPTVWYEFRAKQYNVDFGNGISQFSNWKSVADVVVFEGKIEIPCPVYTPSIGIANFDKLTSTPTVFTQPANLNFQGYGTIPLSGTYEIKVNGITIGSGNVSNGKIDFSYPETVSNLLTKFPSLKSPAKIDLIIKMGSCTFTNSTTISLPSITPIIPVCTPPQIYNPITKQCETPVLPIKCTPPQIYNPITKQCETPVIPRCTPPQIYNPITKQCETPSIPGCSQLTTTVESLNHPAEITDFLAPFYVYLRGVKEVCKADPTNPSFIKKVPKGTIGTITLGNLSSNFYLTDDGIIDIDLAKLINLPSLAGVTDGLIPPVIVQPPIVQPPLPPAPGERIGSYCTLTPYQAFGQTWYKVVHDTIGNLASGDTYSVAKHKAETNQHCFPKAAEPCIKINIYHIVRNRRNIIGFTTTALRNGMYAEGSSNWEYLGSPSDADYIKNTAIPQTMKFLGITRDRICP